MHHERHTTNEGAFADCESQGQAMSRRPRAGAPVPNAKKAQKVPKLISAEKLSRGL
jgi:hypothetical protein